MTSCWIVPQMFYLWGLMILVGHFHLAQESYQSLNDNSSRTGVTFRLIYQNPPFCFCFFNLLQMTLNPNTLFIQLKISQLQKSSNISREFIPAKLTEVSTKLWFSTLQHCITICKLAGLIRDLRAIHRVKMLPQTVWVILCLSLIYF